MATERIFLADDAATAALGERLAKQLRPGDFVLLQGDLGAGKTALARAMVRTLVGDPGLDVPSPSFALVQPYEANGKPVLHADLYRLQHAGEIYELGLFEKDAIVLIEWPERAHAHLPQPRWTVALEVPRNGVGRSATVSW
jgi:tRNA threonylcarbamoyl adenosine modification protein YjeE